MSDLANAFGSLDKLQQILTILAVLGAIPLFFGAVQWIGSLRNLRGRWRRAGEPIAQRLLRFVWDYPMLGKSEASWAVKESAAVLGRLGSAREHPGFGVAIVTTDLASRAFGAVADARIERCVSWAIAQTEKAPPYRVLVDQFDQPSSVTESKPDLRHTLALGVILARAQTASTYAEAYVDLAVTTREPDCGWPSEHSRVISRMFTALYAVELLHLAAGRPTTPVEKLERIDARRSEGLKWLIESREPSGLWSSGALREYSWDCPLTSAWILHRLIPTAGLPVEGWRDCLDDAVFAMTRMAIDPKTWAGIETAQRQRVEARVAAASRKAIQIPDLSPRSSDAAQLYVRSWRERASAWFEALPIDQVDLSTAAFMVFALVPESELAGLGQVVAKDSGTGG